MPNPRWYLQGGVCATAVTSLVGLVHPNIHIVWRKSAEGTATFETLGSASRTSVLNSLEPSTLSSQPLPELSHFYQTHKHKEKCLAHVAMVLVGVSRLDTK